MYIYIYVYMPAQRAASWANRGAAAATAAANAV